MIDERRRAVVERLLLTLARKGVLNDGELLVILGDDAILVEDPIAGLFDRVRTRRVVWKPDA